MGKRFLLLLSVIGLTSLFASAQIQVTGTVSSDEDNEPLTGAVVTIKGQPKTATATDLDGQFTIVVPKEGTVLEVRYVGMNTLQVKATKKPMVIGMSTDAQQLGEVVVTGMSKVDKRLFTGATTKLDAENTRLSGMADVSRSLEGRAAGVSVQNVSGTFGTAPKIRVRGATSIYGNSKPLWVVDGVVLEDAVEISADDLSSGDAIP